MKGYSREESPDEVVYSLHTQLQFYAKGWLYLNIIWMYGNWRGYSRKLALPSLPRNWIDEE